MTLARSLRRIYSAGVAGALLAGVIGLAIDRARFGSSEDEAFARVEASTRSEIASVVASLEDIAASIARSPELFDPAARDPAGARALFDLAAQSLEGRPAGIFAATVYRASGSPIPLAWSGRPSEIPIDRLSGAEAIFVESGPLGLRLVYLRPVTDPATNHRVGMVAAERVLSTFRGIRPLTAEVGLSIPTIAPVTVRPHDPSRPLAAHAFPIALPGGGILLDARVSPDALAAARARSRSAVLSVVIGLLALTLIVSIPPILRSARRLPYRRQIASTGLVIALLAGARGLLWAAPTSAWTGAVFHADTFGPSLRALLRTPADFLLTLLLCAAIVALAFDWSERLRRLARRRRRPAPPRDRVVFAVSQFAAGTLVALLTVVYQIVLRSAVSATSIDVLHFSLHPLDAAASGRLAFAVAIILAQAVALWGGVVVLQIASLGWRLPRSGLTAVAVIALRAAPILAIAAFPRIVGAAPSIVPQWSTAAAGLACVGLAWLMAWIRPRYRHGSQALRLLAGALALLIPAFVLYPSLLHFADLGTRRLVEEEYAQQVIRQRAQLQERLSAVLEQIDRAALPSLVGAPASQAVPSGAALQLWSQTDFAAERLTASIELYAPDGRLASRFGLNLPDYVSATQRWREPSCNWEIFEEASPFGSEERRLLHAGRGICAGASDVPTGGSIVVNVMLDYDTLPFITVRNPYYELIRTPDSVPGEAVRGRDVEFVAYGWGRGSLYSSGSVSWPMEESLLQRIASSRRPFWTTLMAGGARYSAYILNDRVGIYVLGYPAFSTIDHLIILAEMAALGGLAYVALLAAAWGVTALGGRSVASGRQLLREIRASFYRKLFLAFLAASLVPVLILAYATRSFFASQLRAGVQSDAARVAAVAQRVVEEYVALQQREAGAPPDDDIMVWLSRAIGQDVNIYEGPVLLATSERGLFESGLLPFRTPSAVYRAIELDRMSSDVSEEAAAGTRYTLAAAPVRIGESRAILTVPFALREQEIEREIDTLDRRMLLASMLFALLSAGIGYSMAERIGDPVSRLTRATRRIARGDFSARIAQTSTDELRRLVDDFNRMAAELQRQRAELERTHRLEAWAEMARQVAHDIKNPLTPIQLSSEHLMRVHRDKGSPLAPVLEECVAAILSQVKLLRQISAEFSSFASSPTPHPALTALSDLVAAVLEPYLTGLDGRIAIHADVPPTLPPVMVDRTLLSRALTNIIENALHAMPGAGTLTVTGRAANDRVSLSLADTGAGMDRDALQRIFEPYFSTKATGTGLGLTIAKRNVELNGGTVRVESVQGQGTTVTIDLPAA